MSAQTLEVLILGVGAPSRKGCAAKWSHEPAPPHWSVRICQDRLFGYWNEWNALILLTFPDTTVSATVYGTVHATVHATVYATVYANNMLMSC